MPSHSKGFRPGKPLGKMPVLPDVAEIPLLVGGVTVGFARIDVGAIRAGLLDQIVTHGHPMIAAPVISETALAAWMLACEEISGALAAVMVGNLAGVPQRAIDEAATTMAGVTSSSRLCAWCGRLIAGRRRTTCGSSECVTSYRRAKEKGHIRKRDSAGTQKAYRERRLLRAVAPELDRLVKKVSIPDDLRAIGWSSTAAIARAILAGEPNWEKGLKWILSGQDTAARSAARRLGVSRKARTRYRKNAVKLPKQR